MSKILQGNARDVLQLLPENSVDMCVTSPPYWGLRKYGDDKFAPVWGGKDSCEHEWTGYKKTGAHGGVGSSKVAIKGKDNFQTYDDAAILECFNCGAIKCELGQEPTPQMFVSHLADILEEVKRVLKPYGTLWLNMGDTYAGSGGKGSQYTKDVPVYRQHKVDITRTSLIGVPQRLMIEMIDRGWVMRNDIIWHKPDGMPHPETSRLTTNHEHITLFGYFPFFVQEPSTYYYNQLFEPLKHPNVKGDRKFGGNKADGYGRPGYSGKEYKPSQIAVKNMRDTWELTQTHHGEIWTFPTANYTGAHFAVYPIELPRRAIEAGCPKEICTQCGKPRERILLKGDALKTYTYEGQSVKDYSDAGVQDASDVKRRVQKSMTLKYIEWTLCNCENPEYTKGIVLDPFLGSGTTAIAALIEDVDYIGIELFKENVELAKKRIEQFCPYEDDETLLEV